jgi:hypothetical protein
MSLASFPANKNFLSPLGFRLVFDRLPTVEYFCQGATLPSVSINNIEIPNPILPLNVPSTKLNTGDFSVVFRVDEDLANYNELYQWMIDLTFDRETSLYLHMGESRLKKFQTNPNGGVFSDASLTILNSAKSPSKKFSFTEVYPADISPLKFDVTAESLNYLECTATFSFRNFSLVDAES